MTVPVRWRLSAIGGIAPGRAGLGGMAPLARLARVLSWATLAWMGVEGGVAIGAAVLRRIGRAARLRRRLPHRGRRQRDHRDLAVHRHPPRQSYVRAARPAVWSR